jgi:hypothetical protein
MAKQKTKKLKNIGQIIDMQINDVITNALELPLNSDRDIKKLLEIELGRVQFGRGNLEKKVVGTKFDLKDKNIITYMNLFLMEQKITDRLQIFTLVVEDKTSVMNEKLMQVIQPNKGKN